MSRFALGKRLCSIEECHVEKRNKCSKLQDLDNRLTDQVIHDTVRTASPRLGMLFPVTVPGAGLQCYEWFYFSLVGRVSDCGWSQSQVSMVTRPVHWVFCLHSSSDAVYVCPSEVLGVHLLSSQLHVWMGLRVGHC